MDGAALGAARRDAGHVAPPEAGDAQETTGDVEARTPADAGGPTADAVAAPAAPGRPDEGDGPDEATAAGRRGDGHGPDEGTAATGVSAAGAPGDAAGTGEVIGAGDARERLAARLALALVLAPIVVSAVALLVGVGGDYQPTSDHALTELQVRDVGRHEVLVGLYSRDEWSHPGPALFYLLAPFYWLTGGASIGMNVGALAINGGALSGMALIARRHGGLPLIAAHRAGRWARGAHAGRRVRPRPVELLRHRAALRAHGHAHLGHGVRRPVGPARRRRRCHLPGADARRLRSARPAAAGRRSGHPCRQRPPLARRLMGRLTGGRPRAAARWPRTGGRGRAGRHDAGRPSRAGGRSRAREGPGLAAPDRSWPALGGRGTRPGRAGPAGGRHGRRARRHVAATVRRRRAPRPEQPARDRRVVRRRGRGRAHRRRGLAHGHRPVRRPSRMARHEADALAGRRVPVPLPGPAAVAAPPRGRRRCGAVARAGRRATARGRAVRHAPARHRRRRPHGGSRVRLPAPLDVAGAHAGHRRRRLGPLAGARAPAAAAARWLQGGALAALVAVSGVNVATAATAGAPAAGDTAALAAVMPAVLGEAADADGRIVVSDVFTNGSWYARGVVLQLERHGFDVTVPVAYDDLFGAHRATDERGDLNLVVAMDQGIAVLDAHRGMRRIASWQGVSDAMLEDADRRMAAFDEQLDDGEIDADRHEFAATLVDQGIHQRSAVTSYAGGVFVDERAA